MNFAYARKLRIIQTKNLIRICPLGKLGRTQRQYSSTWGQKGDCVEDYKHSYNFTSWNKAMPGARVLALSRKESLKSLSLIEYMLLHTYVGIKWRVPNILRKPDPSSVHGIFQNWYTNVKEFPSLWKQTRQKDDNDNESEISYAHGPTWGLSEMSDWPTC